MYASGIAPYGDLFALRNPLFAGIVHELLHFSVPNHGKLWKSLMRAHLGDYETLAERLQKRRTT